MPAHAEIERRLALLPTIGCAVDVLPDDLFSFYFQAIVARYKLQSSGQEFGFSQECMVQRHDISSLEQNDVQRLLFSLTSEAESIVVVIWANDHTGSMMKYSCFAEYFDDLWYPSSDDVWVVDPAFLWLIEVDHEEILSCYRKPKVGMLGTAHVE